MKNYIITVKHDDGTIKIKTAAISKVHAIMLVSAAENCPIDAIVTIKEI